jgi:hypothetical protein
MTRTPAIVKRMRDYLKQAPDGQIVNSIELASILGTSAHYLREWSSHPELAPFKTRAATGNFWGNEKTIREWSGK